MNQSFFTPINEPYQQQHYHYYSPAAFTINGQKSKKGNNSATSSAAANNNNQQINNNNNQNTPLPSLVKTTSAALLDIDHHQQHSNIASPSSYLYNNHHTGNYNEAPSPSNILPPLSSLLPPVDTLHSTTKYSSNTNYPHAINNSMSYATPQNVSPFNSPRPHDVYPPMSSPVSNTSRSTTESQRRNSISSSATTTCLSGVDTPEYQKRNFQVMITRIISKEDKKVVKISQQQQTNLLMKVLKFNQLKLAQMIAQSNRSHHTISAQLLDNGRKLDVYVLARKKHLGVNSVSNTERRVDCFKLEDFSFNVVVLEPNH